MSGAPAEPSADLPALTGIRGLAAWFVVLYHIRSGAVSYVPAEASWALSKGYLAVDLFFMLSGFVLWLNYSDRLRRDGFAAVPGYLARRVARIWPLHLFILALTLIYALLVAATGELNTVHYPWAELPLHVLLIHNWGFTGGLAWNDPSWSISGEAAAYLLFPLIALAVDWRRLSPAWAVGALLLLALLLSAVMGWNGAFILDRDIPRFGLLRALTEFTMGTIICALWRRWCSVPGVAAALAGGLVAAALLLGFAAGAPETLVVPLFLAGLLLALASTADRPGNPLAARPIHYLGEISYSTYLVHFLLYIVFKILFVEDPANVPPALIGLFLVLTFIASVALYHGVERPAQKALNRLFDRRLSRDKTSSARHPSEGWDPSG
ncbi:MAG TPA: acyltransferase [Allosphingosinicella sp.]|nr:acyltransferase [Allosphingosinicella sp.]